MHLPSWVSAPDMKTLKLCGYRVGRSNSLNRWLINELNCFNDLKKRHLNETPFSSSGGYPKKMVSNDFIHQRKEGQK
ncbi:MAG TPA: hypothetical protein DDZ89_15095 [Clostridiales bacterium]|nr:hypothetical protein [Clostridiales bacterium]